MPALPAISALFLTHFDDIKGQTVIYFQSDGIEQNNIEHISLPSGLHLLEHDLVTVTPEGRPGVGLFRNRTVEGGRGRRMGTIGVIPTSDLPEGLFGLQPALEAIYDELETLDNPFDIDQSRSILDRVWNGAKSITQTEGKGDRAAAVRALVEGRGTVLPEHPIAYLPSLLAILGPLIIPVYKAALTGKRILIYSQPPLLPVSAFAWCIAAMALAPATIGGVGIWLGNVGLMDLAALKQRKSGWVATTSDAIYRSHAVYDLFLDLSTTPPTLTHPPNSSTAKAQSVSYHLSDLPLYRSLLMLDSSPPSISITQPPSTASNGTSSGRNIYSGQGGWWLLAFDVFSSFWALCVGVCEYAVGRGRVGEIHLEQGEEDARLLPRDLEDIEDDDGILLSGDSRKEEEDGAVRRGRLILRQLYHSTYHLHARLVQVVVNRRRGKPIGDKEVKELTGTKLFVSAEEVKFWRDLARYWDLVVEAESGE